MMSIRTSSVAVHLVALVLRWVSTVLVLVLLCAVAIGQKVATDPNATVFINGKWFDGISFRATIFYAVNGLLTRKRPAGTVQTVDLHGGFVVPAFGDAHNHFPESEQTWNWANGAFLQAGVFYVLNPNDIAERSNPLRSRSGTRTTIDVIFAHGGFTKTGGHPTALYESLADQKILPYSKSELESRGFYSIDSLTDIEKKWPQFLATKPDFVKLYLLHSELYGTNEEKRSGGLRPELVRELTRRARAASLRSGAHIESAFDFHQALTGGVDMIMHLPGYHWNPGDTQNVYLISNADARLAARKHVAVVTTTAIATRDEKSEIFAAEHATQIKNLSRLKEAHVTMLIGSDGQPGQGAISEIDYLKSTGVFTNRELLTMWCEVTPAAIFPNRRIGYLREGYEASFLVLDGDPLRDFSAVKRITIKVKNGEVLK